MKALKEGGQSARILGHLTHGRTLTALQALNLFDCFRLAARIEQLRARGHTIWCEMITLGNGKKIAQYSLHVAERHGQAALRGIPQQSAA